MKEELLRLAERCEKATGPDRELDGMIAGIVGTEFHGGDVVRECAFDAYGWGCEESELPKWAGAATNLGALKFTASLDAAMTLVPEGRCWRVIAWPKNTTGPKGGALVEGSPDATGATPALALCAAALRASVKEQNNGK